MATSGLDAHKGLWLKETLYILDTFKFETVEQYVLHRRAAVV